MLVFFFWFWFGYIFSCVLISLKCLRWNERDEDGVILIRNAYGLARIGEAKQIGERHHVHQAPHLFGDVLQAIKCVFCHGLIFLKLLGQDLHAGNIVIRDISGCQHNGLQRGIHFRVVSANPQQQLRRIALLGSHFMRRQLRWLDFLRSIRISVVKRVLVIPGCNLIDLLQRVQRARELAHVDFGQHVSHSWIRGIESGQEGSLIANMVTHVGGNRSCNESVVGSMIGTKVGKHLSDLF